MSGDPTKVGLWPNAKVWWASDVDTADPDTVDDDFPVGWEELGYLDGSAGAAEARNWGIDTRIFAWGGGEVRRALGQFSLTKKFVAIEDNDTTEELIWPGSTSTAKVLPRPARGRIAFEFTEGSKVRRDISTYQAEVQISADIVEQESDITRYELEATIYPDTSVTPAQYWTVQSTESGS